MEELFAAMKIDAGDNENNVNEMEIPQLCESQVTVDAKSVKLRLLMETISKKMACLTVIFETVKNDFSCIVNEICEVIQTTKSGANGSNLLKQENTIHRNLNETSKIFAEIGHLFAEIKIELCKEENKSNEEAEKTKITHLLKLLAETQQTLSKVNEENKVMKRQIVKIKKQNKQFHDEKKRRDVEILDLKAKSTTHEEKSIAATIELDLELTNHGLQLFKSTCQTKEMNENMSGSSKEESN